MSAMNIIPLRIVNSIPGFTDNVKPPSFLNPRLCWVHRRSIFHRMEEVLSATYAPWAMGHEQ